jgi:hypothetical protein
MAAKLSARAEELLAEAALLAPTERRAIVDGLQGIRARVRARAVDARHAELVARVESVRDGSAEMMSLEEVVQSLRDELDF